MKTASYTDRDILDSLPLQTQREQNRALDGREMNVFR
jgi:hypothetical protein